MLEPVHFRPFRARLASVVLLIVAAVGAPLHASAQQGDALVEAIVANRLRGDELNALKRLNEITPEEYQAQVRTWTVERAALTKQWRTLSAARQKEVSDTVDNLQKLRLAPLQQEWARRAQVAKDAAAAETAATMKELEADVKPAAELMAERAMLATRQRAGEVSQAELESRDAAIERQVLAMQAKYAALGTNWASLFVNKAQELSRGLISEQDLARRLADTDSDIGRDAHRAGEIWAAMERNNARAAERVTTPVEQKAANEPLNADLQAILARYQPTGAMGAQRTDFNQRYLTLQRASIDSRNQLRAEARAEFNERAQAAARQAPARQAAAPQPVRPAATNTAATVVAPSSDDMSLGAALAILIGPPGGIVAVVVFVIWLVRTRRRARADREQARRDAARKPDLDAWAALGATAEERERNINAMFDRKSGTIGYGTYLKFQHETLKKNSQSESGETDHTMVDAFIEFRISRNLAAMDNREREFLRAAYLLRNAGAINETSWRRATFCFVWGDGKGVINHCLYDAPREAQIKDWPSAVRYFQQRHSASVDSAVSGLMSYVDKQSGTGPAAVNDVRNRLRGGSAWLSQEDLADSIFAGDSRFGLRLGTLDGGDQVLSYAGEGSIMTIAPPGSGKTQCFVLPNLLSWPGPAVVLDVKGEIYAATSKWRSQNVGPVFKFSPLDPSASRSYNPLTFVRQDSDYIWEDSRFLADMMIVPSGASDPFWENTARDVLTAAIAYITQENDPAQRAMSKLMDLVYGIGWDDMVESLRRNLFVGAMRQMGQTLTDMDRKQRDSVLKTAQSSLSAWQGERIARVTRTSDWNPEDLRTSKATIYLCVNPNEIDSYLSLLRVFIAQHIRLLTNKLPPRDAAPMLFVLDELPRLKKMPPVDEALNIGRQYGIRLWMFAQSYGQLKESYPNAEGMLGSCAVRLFMNVPLNDELAQKISDQLGHRDGPLDTTRVKLVEPLELAGPAYRDVALVVATNTKPAKVRKAFAYRDAELTARMGSA